MAEDQTREADAVAALAGCLRSGSGTTARALAERLDPGVVLAVVGAKGGEDAEGREAVIDRLSGDWPNSAIFRQLACGDARRVGEGHWCVDIALPPVGYEATRATLDVYFSSGRISRIERPALTRPAPIVTDEIPLFVRGVINGALANGTPMTFCYIDLDGNPSLSLRASTQVYDAISLSVWLRTSEGGAGRALGMHPKVAFHYRDDRTRTTLSIQGRGRIEGDDRVRQHVYASIPEVEQRHDPRRQGAALLVTVDRLHGTSLEGPIDMRRRATQAAPPPVR